MFCVWTLRTRVSTSIGVGGAPIWFCRCDEGTSFSLDLLPGYGYPFPRAGDIPQRLRSGVSFAAVFVNAEGEGIAGSDGEYHAATRKSRFLVRRRQWRPWFYGQYLIDSTGQVCPW